MSAKTAVRDALDEVKAKIAKLDEQRNLAAEQQKALEVAYDALNGRLPGTKPAKARKHRRGIRRLPAAKRQSQVLEFLRTHPTQEFSGYHLAEESSREARTALEVIPKSSAIQAVGDLLAENAVTRVGTTARGFPIVQYKPTTIVPGEEVHVGSGSA